MACHQVRQHSKLARVQVRKAHNRADVLRNGQHALLLARNDVVRHSARFGQPKRPLVCGLGALAAEDWIAHAVEHAVVVQGGAVVLDVLVQRRHCYGGRDDERVPPVQQRMCTLEPAHLLFAGDEDDVDGHVGRPLAALPLPALPLPALLVPALDEQLVLDRVIVVRRTPPILKWGMRRYGLCPHVGSRLGTRCTRWLEGTSWLLLLLLWFNGLENACRSCSESVRRWHVGVYGANQR